MKAVLYQVPVEGNTVDETLSGIAFNVVLGVTDANRFKTLKVMPESDLVAAHAESFAEELIFTAYDSEDAEW